MKKTLLCLFTGFALLSAHAQKVVWEKTLGGKHSEYLFDMVPTVDYGFLLAGSSFSDKTGSKTSEGQGNLDYWLWKMDKDGEEEWQKSFGASGMDLLQCLIPTGDAGYLLGGTSNSPKDGHKTEASRGKNDLWLIKINAAGAEEWQKTLGGSGDDRLVTIKRLADGGYIIGANTNSPVSGEKSQQHLGGLDLWILRLDKKGKLLWEKTFGGIYNDEVKTIVPTKDGFIIGAQSNSPIGANKAVDTNGGYDIWLLTLDHNGNLLQQHSYGGTADDFLTDLLPVDNGYLLAGTSSSESSGTKTVSAETMNDFWTVQLDAKMQPTDQKTYDFKGDDVLTSVLLDSDQNLLLSGYTIHPKTHKKSYVSIHINAQGEKIWEKELSTDGDDLLRKAIITRDGGYVFAGNSTGKTSALKKGYQGRNDYWIVKLNTKEKTKTPEIQIEAFPNPTEGFTNVVINHEYEEGQMILSDLSGKILHTAPLQYDMIAVDLSGYPQGVYIINIKTNVINRSVKVIKK